MNRRLQQFLSAENISQAQFADTIGVARASVSHILAGRNKPGYDFLTGLMRNYPMLNIEWLLSGNGKMYRQNTPTPQEQNLGLFDENLFSEPADIQPDTNIDASTNIDTSSQPNETIINQTVRSKIATKIIVFYDDNTFDEFRPSSNIY